MLESFVLPKKLVINAFSLFIKCSFILLSQLIHKLSTNSTLIVLEILYIPVVSGKAI